MDKSLIKDLGPLGDLAGIWEGEKGDDTAPSDDRGTEINKFRERITFEPLDPVQNHEQWLYGLRYGTTAWRIGEEKPFHEETGYWLWDPAAEQIFRCFIVPRGVAVLAGGAAKPGARTFELTAQAGSPIFGISSNPFLDREFKTERYVLNVTIHGNDSWSYEEDTQILIKGQKELFHHTDKNTLRRIQ